MCYPVIYTTGTVFYTSVRFHIVPGHMQGLRWFNWGPIRSDLLYFQIFRSYTLIKFNLISVLGFLPIRQFIKQRASTNFSLFHQVLLVYNKMAGFTLALRLRQAVIYIMHLIGFYHSKSPKKLCNVFLFPLNATSMLNPCFWYRCWYDVSYCLYQSNAKCKNYSNR